MKINTDSVYLIKYCQFQEWDSEWCRRRLDWLLYWKIFAWNWIHELTCRWNWILIHLYLVLKREYGWTLKKFDNDKNIERLLFCFNRLYHEIKNKLIVSILELPYTLKTLTREENLHVHLLSHTVYIYYCVCFRITSNATLSLLKLNMAVVAHCLPMDDNQTP